MDDKNPALIMAEGALVRASQNPVTGHEDLVSSAILWLQTTSTPCPWLVPEAVALIRQGVARLPRGIVDATVNAENYGGRRFKVYPDGNTSTVSIGSINHDGCVRDLRGQLLYRIEGNHVYDIAGDFFGVIHSRGENAVVTDSENEDYLKLLLVSADLP